MLFSTRSNGRQFLRDFVTGPSPSPLISDDAEDAPAAGSDQADVRLNACTSSGARLAAWLQPEPRICPALCYVQEPNREELKQGWTSLITVVTRDQYGDLAYAPDLKVRGNSNSHSVSYRTPTAALVMIIKFHMRIQLV